MTRNSCPLFKSKLQASALKVDSQGPADLIALAHSVATSNHDPCFIICSFNGHTVHRSQWDLVRAAESHALTLKTSGMFSAAQF